MLAESTRDKLQALASAMLTVTGKFNAHTMYTVCNGKFILRTTETVLLWVEKCESGKYLLRVMVDGQEFRTYIYAKTLSTRVVRSNVINLCNTVARQ